jgi:hypothetical protein
MCIELIDMRRRGYPPRPATILQAVFEDDIAAIQSQSAKPK